MVKKEILAIGCGSVVLLVCVGGMVAVMAGPLVIELAKEMTVKDLGMNEAQTTESERRGEAIIEALQAYHEANGRYPDSLDALVPEHLAEVQPPTAGTGAWEYAAGEDGQRFFLQFGVGQDMYPSHSISSDTLGQGWYRDY